MVGNIIYQINPDTGERVGEDNWTGHFSGNSSIGNVWLYIKEGDNGIPPLKKGDFIHYGGYDNDNDDGDYRIEEATAGIYRVEKYDNLLKNCKIRYGSSATYHR